jgi:hypothetical protein
MTQRKIHSLLETCLSTAIGYGVAVLAQIVIFPFFSISVSFGSNLWIAGFFTLISLIRSYFVRRLFNHLHFKGIL